MILQRLAEHYDRIAAAGNDGNQIVPAGFSQQKISFCVVLELDGKLNAIQSMQQQKGRALVATPMLLPGQGKPSGSKPTPCFLWDNAAYMLGYKAKDPKPSTTRKQFAAFRNKHISLEEKVKHPSFTAVCTFLRDWNPDKALEIEEHLSKVTTNFGVFRIAGEMRYVHELVTTPVMAEDTEPASESKNEEGVCLVSGVRGQVARLHEPKIKGVADAQPGGALLVSFNASAYESYGKSQSYNAPVGAATAFKYTNALNFLLNRRDRRVSLGDSTVVFWADHPNNVLEDAISAMFAEPLPTESPIIEEDQERLREAALLLKQLRDGTGATVIAPDGQPTKFFLLGLSPNASRISVRLWIEADAAELRRRLGRHLRDVELAGSNDDRPLTLREIVRNRALG